ADGRVDRRGAAVHHRLLRRAEAHHRRHLIHRNPMTLEAVEAWAPGARRDVPLAPLSAPTDLDGVAVMAAGATSGVSTTAAEYDADGLLRVRLSAPEPGTLRFLARVAVTDAVSLWRPGSGSARGTLPPAWSDPRTTRALADVPIGSLI